MPDLPITCADGKIRMIDRPMETIVRAAEFTGRGGHYFLRVTSEEGHVELVAAMKSSTGEPVDVVTLGCKNGPGLPRAIDDLVRESVRLLDEVQ